MKTHVIIPAAGEGSRFNSDIPKPLVMLQGKPVLIHSLEIFDKSDLIAGMVIAVPEEYKKDFEEAIAKFSFKKPIKIVVGGKNRQESVANGLDALDPNTDYVAVHDAARPLLSVKVLEDAIHACVAYKAVIVAVPVKPTIKRIDPMNKEINATLDRSVLWEAQTPQIFAYELLAQAHRQGVGLEATDDAFLVERFGAKVKVVQGEYRNIKITTPEDLKIAEALLET